MRNDLTEILVVLDRSGSMAVIEADMRGGFDSFVAEQRKVPGECRLTLVQFDNEYEVVYADKPIEHVRPLVLIPRGTTALHDALGRSIQALGDRLNARAQFERPGKVVVLIITDGLENASSEFTGPTVARMVKHQQEKYDWAFVFLGADQQTALAAAELGISRNVAQYDVSRVGTKAVWSGVSAGISGYRSGTVGSTEVFNQAAYDTALADLNNNTSDPPEKL